MSLVGQWQAEAQAKTAANCRIHPYHGQSRIRDPQRLATEFDVVVTTYQTLQVGSYTTMVAHCISCCSGSALECDTMVTTYQTLQVGRCSAGMVACTHLLRSVLQRKWRAAGSWLRCRNSSDVGGAKRSFIMYDLTHSNLAASMGPPKQAK